MRRGISILVVDDDENMRALLESILGREEYTVASAESVAEAKLILGELSFDVIISDIRMPDETGYDLLKYAKRNYPDIGVILMTGHGDIYSVKDALLLGAEEYIQKPFRSFEIAVLVERVYWRMRAGLGEDKPSSS
ncbi:MAG: response regulator [Candidatus Zixiibacteriota bacterium]